MEDVTARRKRATYNAMLKIAKAKIAIHNLPDTPEEYIEKCMVNTKKA